MTAPEPTEADQEAAEAVVGRWWDAHQRAFAVVDQPWDQAELDELANAIALVVAAARIDGLHAGLTAEGLTDSERRGLAAVYGPNWRAPVT